MSDLITPVMTRYANFAMTGDGIPEIQTLAFLEIEAEFPDPLPDQRLALVLVESRLLGSAGDASLKPALLKKLRRLKSDMRAEGLTSRFITASVYQGPIHKDGRIVLAMRRFLRDIKTTFSRLEGVTLVGNFPESTIVRNFAWAPAPDTLVIGPELISERADIVLADLTGAWENLYRQADFSPEKIFGFPDDATVASGWHDGERVLDANFVAKSYIAQNLTFRDAFYLDDAQCTISDRTPTTMRLQLRQAERNSEANAADLQLTNVLARPDIVVSRINARHIAVNPNPGLVGADGHRFLDAAGNPQIVVSPNPLFPGEQQQQHLNLFTYQDFDLERQLVNEYFDRNHRYRVGGYSNLPFRAAAITGTDDFSANQYNRMLSAAAADFTEPIEVQTATLKQYVDFMKAPAVLKYVMAHSDPILSEFVGCDAAELESAVGGLPAHWVYGGGRYTPSYEGQTWIADLYLHRAMRQRGAYKAAGACLVMHGGCNVNSIYDTQTKPYSSPEYGRWSNSEAFLFYTNCVALLSRAKGFNDAPNGFTEGFRVYDRANFGSCWLAYFNAQAADAGLTTWNVQRKRAYFWSLNGDWTLRLRNRNGYGLLGLDAQLSSVAVHPNQAWIDNWNYDARTNPIRGIGDFDGDGVDELIVTSDWGIGILRHDGVSFRTLMQAPRDTWFGGWRWDATVNTGRDQIKAVANFTGDVRREIMVWSSWGIATLAYGAGSLTPTRIQPNGTRFGGWLFSTAENSFVGHGNFTADGRAHMVITSGWGLGLISMETTSALFMAPNGTRLGEWLLGTSDDRVHIIADLDGDGLDEIVVTSPWGLAVLKMINGSLRSVAMHPNGDNLAGYIVNNDHNFALADRLLGTTQNQLIVMDDLGIHVLKLEGARLKRIAFAGNGTRIDGWLVGTGDNRLQVAGDLNADGRAEFIIRSPWGIGAMALGDDLKFHCRQPLPFGCMLGDWHLEAGDLIAGSGRFMPGMVGRTLLLTKP